jgi:hypothetical protein
MWTAASAFGAHGSTVFRLLAADDDDARGRTREWS